MSDDFYPISLIQKLRVTKRDRTIKDSFEDGTTGARRTWPAGYFKRTFEITHSPLTRAEFDYLKAFYEAHGTYDSFIFRDNVNRDGNARVRFVDPLLMEFAGAGRPVMVKLEEVSATITVGAITEAAGVSPLVWIDPTRDVFYQHAGEEYNVAATTAGNRVSNYSMAWQAGTPKVSGALGDRYRFDGTLWAKTTENIAELTGTAPDFTIVLVARYSATTSMQTLASIGGAGGDGMGIAITNYGSISPTRNDIGSWVGDPATANPVVANSPADTWRTYFYMGWTGGDFYVNTQHSILTGDPGANYGAGPFSIGNSTGGGRIANPSNSLTNCDIGLAMLFGAKLTTTQMKAVHNLICLDYGINQVS